ncbi:snaclec coagulation factor IX/factor X-binding protein subunit B3-like [Salminus brasiliensis]|uniref:snaclec coagulation factor IX/factor X-binding protein subunit B3-like n=1 Tax=Salminus brasiliensis TaxID=930266 RepID=UPI003B834142
MKVWIVPVLLCAAFTLQITEGAAVISPKEAAEISPENVVEISPGEVIESSPEEAAEINAEEADVTEHEQNLNEPLGLDVKQASEPRDSVSGRAVICPPGWFGHRSRCYLLVKTTNSWLNAEAYCVNNQASLASVQNPDEHHFLQSLLTVSGTSVAWIGAYNFLNTWKWIDRAGFYYTNWQSQSSVSSAPCAYMRSTGGWSNTNCATAYAFFCSMKPSTC